MTAYNLGRGGYGPYEYLQLLRLFGLAKRPRVVVMQIYEGNDLRDAARYFDYVAASADERRLFLDRAGWKPLRYEPARWLDNPLGRHSYAFDFAVVGAASVASDAVDGLTGAAERKIDLHYTVTYPDGPLAMNTQNNDQDEVRTARDVAGGTLRPELFDRALDDFAQLARAHGFLAVVSYAPAAYTAYADRVTFADAGVAAPLADFSRRQREHLADGCAARGLRFVDLTPTMQAEARRRGRDDLLYFPVNVHFTPAGHQVAAEAMAGAIRTALAAP
jgi:hypothetical protein